MIAYSASLDREKFAKGKKARLAQNVLMGIVIYLPLAFMLADSVLLEFFIFVAKLFAFSELFSFHSGWLWRCIRGRNGVNLWTWDSRLNFQLVR